MEKNLLALFLRRHLSAQRFPLLGQFFCHVHLLLDPRWRGQAYLARHRVMPYWSAGYLHKTKSTRPTTRLELNSYKVQVRDAY